MEQRDALVLGAGGAGLLCAATAGRRGRRVLVLEHNERIGKKILVSGGGRCNFTNRRVSAENFLSANAHFARSALARFAPEDFLALIERHAVPFHERKWGQLFCNDSAKRITELLAAECTAAAVEIRVNCKVLGVARDEGSGGAGATAAVAGDVSATGDASPAPRFVVRTSVGDIACRSLVVATGGLSWPRLGATDFGYRLARQFGLEVVPPRPGLVPLLFSRVDRSRFAELAGIAVPARVSCGGTAFEEATLFTHGGLSGPAILQISNYWRPGATLTIDLLPQTDILAELAALKAQGSNDHVRTALCRHLPRRLVDALLEVSPGEAVASRPVSQCADRDLEATARAIKAWVVLPVEDAGWDKAEVTLGGVATSALSSRTLEARAVPGLFFVGEVVDVTGWLGGFNFQWAWASGAAAGDAV